MSVGTAVRADEDTSRRRLSQCSQTSSDVRDPDEEEATVAVNAHHERYLTLLMDRARESEHPSHQQLARIESSLTDRSDAEAYVELLLDKSERQQHPSLRLIDRAGRIVRMLAIADRLDELEAQRRR